MMKIFRLAVATSAAFLALALAASAQTYSVVHTFGLTDGANPMAGLFLDTNGNFWGTTEGGGAHSAGEVFEITANGTFSVAYSFAGSDGAAPEAALIADKLGNLWGTTASGGSNKSGTVFKIATNGTLSVVHDFAGGSDGATPTAGLTIDKKGNLWGTTLVGGASNLGTVFKIPAKGVYSVAHSFGSGTDGSEPWAGLFKDKKGNLWGTTTGGGANGGGTLFKIAPNGSYSIVRNFPEYSGDGYWPFATLVQDKQGNLWGTTSGGGSYPGTCAGGGCGTVFEIAAKGAYSIVHSFDPTQAFRPVAPLLLDASGNLWSITELGGAYGGGTVFEIAANGTYSVIYGFVGGTLGAYPSTGLVGDKTGNLWGTTEFGGAGNLHCLGQGHTCGVVFELTP